MKSLLGTFLFGLLAAGIHAQCLVEAKFSYLVDGESLELTNTSTDEPAGPDYSWYVGGYSTIAENPTYDIPDLLGDTEIEIRLFVDNLPESTCRDAIHVFIPRDPGPDCPPTVPDFSIDITADEITFNNTSQHVEPGANIYWNIGGEIYEDDDESITFPVSDFLGVNYYSLHIDYTAEIEGCEMRTFRDSMVPGIENASLVAYERQNNDFTVFPSPINETITVSFANPQNGGIVRIYDLGGKLIQTEIVGQSASHVEFAVKDLVGGNYLVQYQSKDNHVGRGVQFTWVGSN